MSEKVVALPGFKVPTPRGEPHPGIVKMLETYLQQAQAGELVGCAIAGVINDGSPVYSTSTAFDAAAGASGTLENALTRLNRRFGAYMDE